MPVPDMELSLHRVESKEFKGTQRYRVELRFRDPNDEGAREPVWGESRFDFDALRSAQTDADTYGEALTRSLFADEALLAGFQDFRNRVYAAGGEDAALRLRLYVGPSAPELQTLRWETLRQPDTGRRLLTDQRVFFSRFLSGPDWRPVLLRAQENLRTLVVIANPSDIGDQATDEGGWPELPRLMVEEEERFARASLRDFNPTLLSTGEATASAIFDRLRDEFDILYLVCHGVLDESGEPWLILEGEDGRAQELSGREFAERLDDLKHRPRLIVLASCQSAGTGNASGPAAPTDAAAEEDDAASQRNHHALSACAPRLMRVGIPAVLAMQGRVLMSTVGKFMRVFFDELRRDGQIDRAMAVARGAVRDEPDSWAPVLYMRLLSGRIWYVPGFSSEGENEECWPALLARIDNRSCTPILGAGLLEPLIGSTREIARHWAEQHHFPMFPSDQDDLPQVAQYLSIVHEDFYLRDAFVRELLRQVGYEIGADEEDEDKWAVLRRALSEAGARLREANPSEAHRVLASLKCPLYVTTNPDSLLDDALKAAGKEPRTELCRWREGVAWSPSVFDEAGTGVEDDDEDKGYMPRVKQPLVYHLFGHLGLPDSLVLTEDNYFDYLIGVSRRGKENPIPQVVRTALTGTALLFVGFKIDDWDFRVFFRSLMNQEGRVLLKRFKHVAVQVDPESERFLDPERARHYLKQYFVGADIYVYWGSTADFIAELRKRWEPFIRVEAKA